MEFTAEKRIDTFDLALAPIDLTCVDKLQELAISTGWPHRAADIAFLINQGEGYFACDSIGRVLGSVMRFPIARGLSSIGMVITTPALQTRGTGKWLMDQILTLYEKDFQLLYSTRAGYRLYIACGFEPRRTIVQYQGIAHPVACSAMTDHVVSPVSPQDLPLIQAYDRDVYEFDRSGLIDSYWRAGAGLKAMKGSQLTGYALKRDFGYGKLIGPLCADTPELAHDLLRAHLMADTGHFLRADLILEDSRLLALMAEAHMEEASRVTEMHRGEKRGAFGGTRMYLLGSQACG